ncbi:hypothetical protein HYFRA_00012448 [Hymenoscyphus fraxineus]|uniref:2EXR domain-containing protein n=1 Tax=Hymenoscyphus fraxineus TaxID=746836 RepID=A0A9N9L9D1_9HELO|nr:hypothetical protein HYFRA_00012448 [Hymenoscyphus fraxineus]
MASSTEQATNLNLNLSACPAGVSDQPSLMRLSALAISQAHPTEATIETSPSTPTFPCFPNLPSELRCIVWEFACYHSRTIRISRAIIDTTASWNLVSSDRDPGTLLACRESRSIAMGIYKPLLSASQFQFTTISFNPTVDIVSIDVSRGPAAYGDAIPVEQPISGRLATGAAAAIERLDLRFSSWFKIWNRVTQQFILAFASMGLLKLTNPHVRRINNDLSEFRGLKYLSVLGFKGCDKAELAPLSMAERSEMIRDRLVEVFKDMKAENPKVFRPYIVVKQEDDDYEAVDLGDTNVKETNVVKETEPPETEGQ